MVSSMQVNECRPRHERAQLGVKIVADESLGEGLCGSSKQRFNALTLSHHGSPNSRGAKLLRPQPPDFAIVSPFSKKMLSKISNIRRNSIA